MVLEQQDMRYIIAALLLVGCAQQIADPVEISGEEYPVVTNDWPAATAFCMRHIQAAKTKPEYLVDICVKECELNPSQPWCEDLKEILKNDQGRNTPSPN